MGPRPCRQLRAWWSEPRSCARAGRAKKPPAEGIKKGTTGCWGHPALLRGLEIFSRPSREFGGLLRQAKGKPRSFWGSLCCSTFVLEGNMSNWPKHWKPLFFFVCFKGKQPEMQGLKFKNKGLENHTPDLNQHDELLKRKPCPAPCEAPGPQLRRNAAQEGRKEEITSS